MSSENEYESDNHGFAEGDDNTVNRRGWLKLLGGTGVAAAGGKAAKDGIPKRPAGEGPLGAGIADDINEFEERSAPAKDVIEWAIEAGDHSSSHLRPGYLNTTSMFDFDTLDVEISEESDSYNVSIDVDLRFTQGEVEDAIQEVHEDPEYDDEVEIRNLQGHMVEDDIFAYQNEFDHEEGNFWMTDRTGITVADTPASLEEFIGDTPAEFMATFAYAVVEEGEVGEGHPFRNFGSSLIDTIDTDYWADQYEGLEAGSYDITFNLKPREESSEEPHSFNYSGEIDDVTRQFRSNTYRLRDSIARKAEEYLDNLGL